jgi:transcriptional regulator with XRE-family HTH domain
MSMHVWVVVGDLQNPVFLGHMCPMPKKPKSKSPLQIVREGAGCSQPEFARRLGVTASHIKKLESRKRFLTQEVASRIFVETGVMFVLSDRDDPIGYTGADHIKWKEATTVCSRGAKIAAKKVSNLVELMFAAAARPGANATFQIFNALNQAIENIKDEFELDKHIDAELRDRYSTETKLYTVRELRDNNLLAGMVGFEDKPEYKDDDKIPLTKPIKWFPSKEIFNVMWQHRNFTAQLRQTPEVSWTPEDRAKLEHINQQMEAAISQNVPL